MANRSLHQAFFLVVLKLLEQQLAMTTKEKFKFSDKRKIKIKVKKEVIDEEKN